MELLMQEWRGRFTHSTRRENYLDVKITWIGYNPLPKHEGFWRAIFFIASMSLDISALIKAS
jgi:hypothetical protein